MTVSRLVRSMWAFAEGYRETLPTFKDGVQRAWVYYWRRVAMRGRDSVPRSIVPRDLGVYQPWGRSAGLERAGRSLRRRGFR